MDYHPRQKIVGREVAVVNSGGSTVAICELPVYWPSKR